MIRVNAMQKTETFKVCEDGLSKIIANPISLLIVKRYRFFDVVGRFI